MCGKFDLADHVLCDLAYFGLAIEMFAHIGTLCSSRVDYGFSHPECEAQCSRLYTSHYIHFTLIPIC
jgi:hypothetical protein